MPLCFWVTQTAVAPIDTCARIGRLDLKPYLPPHTAATIIQRVYRSHWVDEWESQSRLSCAQQDQVVLPMPKGDLVLLVLDQIKEIQESRRKLRESMRTLQESTWMLAQIKEMKDSMRKLQESTQKLQDKLMLELGIYFSWHCSLDNG